MSKKVFALIAILLSSACVATIVFAQQQEKTSSFIVPVRPRYPKVYVMYGVGLDRESMDTEPVVFLRIKYGNSVNNYLIVDGEIYEMEETFQRYDWETGTKIYQYESHDGSVMIVLIQRFSYGGVGISAEFKDYLIVFESYRHPTPLRKIEPIPHVAKKLEKGGIDIEEILKSTSEPISEWIE